eukprot:5415081-Pleurochrysis_carterae.AAC.1
MQMDLFDAESKSLNLFDAKFRIRPTPLSRDLRCKRRPDFSDAFEGEHALQPKRADTSYMHPSSPRSVRLASVLQMELHQASRTPCRRDAQQGSTCTEALGYFSQSRASEHT